MSDDEDWAAVVETELRRSHVVRRLQSADEIRSETTVDLPPKQTTAFSPPSRNLRTRRHPGKAKALG